MNFTKYENLIIKEREDGTATVQYRHSGTLGTVLNLRMPGIYNYLWLLDEEARKKAEKQKDT